MIRMEIRTCYQHNGELRDYMELHFCLVLAFYGYMEEKPINLIVLIPPFFYSICVIPLAWMTIRLPYWRDFINSFFKSLAWCFISGEVINLQFSLWCFNYHVFNRNNEEKLYIHGIVRLSDTGTFLFYGTEAITIPTSIPAR